MLGGEVRIIGMWDSYKSKNEEKKRKIWGEINTIEFGLKTVKRFLFCHW